jgi:hypothetical protein
VGLVVQVQRVADEFFEIDFGRAFERTAIRPPVVAASAFPWTAFARGTPLRGTAFAMRLALPVFRFLLNFSHKLDLSR